MLYFKIFRHVLIASVHTAVLKKAQINKTYRTEGNFGGGKIWQIKQNITVGEIKFGELLAKYTPYLN